MMDPRINPYVYLPAAQTQALPGPAGFTQALGQALDEYHRPHFIQPSAQDLAALDEEQRKVMEQRQKAVEAYSTGMNTAVKNYWDAQAANAKSLADILTASGQMAHASATARKAAGDAAGILLAPFAQKSANQIYGTPAGDVTSLNQGASNLSLNLMNTWNEVQQSNLGADPVTAAVALVDKQGNTFSADAINAIQSNGLGQGSAGDEGTYNYALNAFDHSVTAWLVNSGLSVDQQAKIHTQALQHFQDRVDAAMGDTSRAWHERGRQALRDADSDHALIEQLRREFHLPADIVKRMTDQFDQNRRLMDPLNPENYATMARMVGDSALSPLATQILELDNSLADIDARRRPIDDPFLAITRRFAADHPWWGTWAASQGFHHPEEAMRWLTSHPELVPQLDTAWKGWQDQSAQDAMQNPDASLDALSGTTPTVDQFRGYLQTREQQSRDLARQNQDPSQVQNLATNGLGRALYEIGHIFDRSHVPLTIPAAPAGAYSTGSMSLAGMPMAGEFGQAPRTQSGDALPQDTTAPNTPGAAPKPVPGTPAAPTDAPATPAADAKAAFAPAPTSPLEKTAAPEDPAVRLARLRQKLDPYATRFAAGANPFAFGGPVG